MRTIKGYLDEWRVQEYLLLTFFISWLSWGILILLTAFKVAEFTSPIGIILFGIGGFGPTISAIMCLEGKITFKKVISFIFDHKKKTFQYFLLFAVLEIMCIGLSSLEVNPAMPWFSLPIVLLVCTFIGGGNEELGWRGTLQPVMERIMSKKLKNKSLSFILATLLVGLIWALWHLPLWFVAGSGQQGMNFGQFALEAVLLSFWLACVYRRAHSVFYCMLLHGLANLAMSFFIIKINWVLILGYAFTTALAIILARNSTPAQKDERN